MKNNKELQVVVMPDCTLKPEWIKTSINLTEKTKTSQDKIFNYIVNKPNSWMLFLGFCDKNNLFSPSLTFFYKFAQNFTEKIIRTPDLEKIRHKVKFEMTDKDFDQIIETAPMMTGAEYINRKMLSDIWQNLHKAYSNKIKAHEGTVESFIRSYNPNAHIVGRVFFHLVENRDDEMPFAFISTYSTGLTKKGKSKHLPLKYAIKEYEGNKSKMLELLSTVNKAAEKSSLIKELIETGELFHPLAWSSSDAYEFLKEIPDYEEAGILCRIPNWWKNKQKDIRLSVSIGNIKPSFIGMDAILNFSTELAIGDIRVSEAETRKILEESEGLAFIKNRWIAVDHKKLKQTLDAYEKANKLISEEGFSIKDALRMQFNPEKILKIKQDEVDFSVSNGIWLESVLEKLRNPELTPSKKPDKKFKAKLRAYQQKGLNWLNFLNSLQFGALLADDMGLGKTVQLLGLLNIIKKRGNNKASLLIVPASLVSNWISEIEKFFPSLKYFAAHPGMQSGKKINSKSKKELDTFDLVITTYALIQKYDFLKNHSWNIIVLDEAQAIKNPLTKQTKAVKKLLSQNRIILTGTPVENRLSDLWSLFDFLNPGLLGNKTEFSQFAKRLNKNPEEYKKLRKLTSPYILRRLKTDKSVISDLPEKVEMKTYAGLSKKQITLYKQMTEDIKNLLDSSEGIEKKGIILASLIKFKQLCNHPDQYLGTGTYKEKESGKFLRLREICETIYEKRERVLVFTQFKETTEPLSDFLEEIFKRKGLVIHGSIPIGKRKKIIDKFQSDEYYPYIVLSLKAGGTGLNLTRANHVIHFDRWWNPAVENQATDRAFRIGQKKNVVVHKFITKGTIEEKIDQMLDSKKELSDKVIAQNSETFITEMDNRELMDLFKLTL